MKRNSPRVPKRLQGILWSKDINEIDPEKDRVYLTHQILRYGSLKDINWLFNLYPREIVKTTFIENPLPVYSRASLNFIKQYILKLEGNLDEKAYVRTLY